MTEKLFYEDSHMITFSAVVKACEKVGDYYEAVLDRTAFFPEGGGQSADRGVIDGVNVIDVQEKGDFIYHTVDAPLELGATVYGTIDWEERFSNMQQHSGEHIVSGIVHAMFGYNNVGFHMGKDVITIDFNGPITKEELREVEKRANEAVVQNLDVQVLYPTKEELVHLKYRSKIEIEGQVRLVTVPGHDLCACCAPHVKKTGEIGLIKFVGMQNYKGGVRVSLLCGNRAIADYDQKSESIQQLSEMLSAPGSEVVQEVSRLKNEISEQKYRIARLQQELLEYKVLKTEPGVELLVMFEKELEGNMARELVNLAMKRMVRVAAVFVGEGENYRYVIGSQNTDVRPIAKILNEKFMGRGGGKPEMVQGSITGSESEIREAMEYCRNENF